MATLLGAWRTPLVLVLLVLPLLTPLVARAQAPAASLASNGRGLSNLSNPAISASGLLLGGFTTRSSDGSSDANDLPGGLQVQELELQFSAVVDPYLRADLTLAGNSLEIGFEEAYLTTLTVPHVNLRAGLLKAAFGKHNTLHTHAFPFLTAPQPWRALLGPEGLSDVGLSAEVLVPLPFFTELTAQIFQGGWLPLERLSLTLPSSATSTPSRRAAYDFAYLGHARGLFDLTDDATLELGASYLGGRNAGGGTTHLAASDLTLKWRSSSPGVSAGVEWSTEVLWQWQSAARTSAQRGGGFTSLRYQFLRAWWGEGRGSLTGFPDDGTGRTWRGEALVAYVPSEFSALRVQYGAEYTEATRQLIHEVFEQLNFSIGSHPSHAY